MMNLIQSGKLIHSQHAGNHFDLEFENAFASITFYRPSVVRVQANITRLQKTHSYAVEADAEEVKLSFTSDGKEVSVKSSQLKLVFSIDDMFISFYTIENKLINTDEPGLGTQFFGNTSMVFKSLQNDEKFIGLGEKTGPLNRRGYAYTNWNTDASNYDKRTDPLYASIPFYIGIHSGLVYGIFLDNTYRTDFNFGASNNRFSSFSTHGEGINYYFIHGKDIPEIIFHYTWLTGRMKLPPLWSLGFHQSRWSYYPDKEVQRIAQTFRDKKIPVDAIHLDIHYMEGYRVFTWDKSRFPEPEKMIRELSDKGFNLIAILDPGVKKDEEYTVYTEGKQKDLFVKYPDGMEYNGEVWPGVSAFPDFTSPDVRNWWSHKVEKFMQSGLQGIWNDMNEPITWGKNFPIILLHAWENEGCTHAKAHNVYGMLMAWASYQGALKSLNGKRPFILSRAGFAGLQRYSALWTGDNTCTEEHMLLGIRLLNSLGLSGMPFVGIDTGGFSGYPKSESPTPSLYARWISINAFTPFFRVHSAITSKAQEPWAFNEEVEYISRKYIEIRYQLLPYLYSIFHEATKTGMPVMRALPIYFPHDEKVYSCAYEHQFMLGSSIMVAPVKSTTHIASAYLPGYNYFNFYTGELMGTGEVCVPSPLHQLPVFVKEGSFIPMQQVVQHTGELPDDETLHIHFYYGSRESCFAYYEDDGSTFAYIQGDFYARTFSHAPSLHQVKISAVEGSFKSKFKNIALHVYGMPEKSLFRIIGTQCEWTFDDKKMVGLMTNDSAQILIVY